MYIEVSKDRIYGNIVYYPSCDKAKKFAQIAGTKTLTSDTMFLIKKLGYEIRLGYKEYKEREIRC